MWKKHSHFCPCPRASIGFYCLLWEMCHPLHFLWERLEHNCKNHEPVFEEIPILSLFWGVRRVRWRFSVVNRTKIKNTMFQELKQMKNAESQADASESLCILC